MTGGAETILICEDDPIVRSLSAEVLGLYGYRVIQAADGQAAVDAFVNNEESIQLVVLDAIMPKKKRQSGISGDEVDPSRLESRFCERLRGRNIYGRSGTRCKRNVYPETLFTHGIGGKGPGAAGQRYPSGSQ